MTNMRNLKTIKSKNQKRKQVKKLTHDVTKQFIEYLEKHYELRFNSVLGYTEIRPAGRKTAFAEVDERMRNTLAIKARLDGLNVWDKDVKRYVDSHLIAIYDPVSDFIGRVRGQWDGHDYIGDLADCVPTAACQWKEWFHTWMLGMVAQWMGIDKTHGNSVAPLLISRQIPQIYLLQKSFAARTAMGLQRQPRHQRKAEYALGNESVAAHQY